MNLRNTYEITNAETRSISPDNFGKGWNDYRRHFYNFENKKTMNMKDIQSCMPGSIKSTTPMGYAIHNSVLQYFVDMLLTPSVLIKAER